MGQVSRAKVKVEQLPNIWQMCGRGLCETARDRTLTTTITAV